MPGPSPFQVPRCGALVLWALIGCGAPCQAADPPDAPIRAAPSGDIKAEMARLIAEDSRKMANPKKEAPPAAAEGTAAASNLKPLLLAPVVVKGDRISRKLQAKMDEVALKEHPFTLKDGGVLHLGPIPLNISYNPYFKGLNLFSLFTSP